MAGSYINCKYEHYENNLNGDGRVVDLLNKSSSSLMAKLNWTELSFHYLQWNFIITYVATGIHDAIIQQPLSIIALQRLVGIQFSS